MQKLLTALCISILVMALLPSMDIFATKQDSLHPDKHVYLIKNHDQNLKNGLGVRHNFDLGFTTFLTQYQVQNLQAQGVQVEKVPLYYLTKPPSGCEPWPECKNGGGSGGTRFIPSDQTPWGIEKIYNNTTIASTNGGLGVDVAVLDTGVNTNHPDLKNRITQCSDFTSEFTPKNSCNDENGHGTHVAGTILADGGSDGLGIYGVAPAANLLAYKVCTSSGCWTDDIAAAIDYAGSHGAEIVSMSFGGNSESILIKNAISRNPYLLFVAAAGNDGPSDGSIDYPAANVNVIAIGAIDVNEAVASWSSRGINDGDYVVEEREVEFGAPGVSVESTWNDGAYKVISGTSMATPHISGLAAKLWTGNAVDTRALLHERALLHDLYTYGDDKATGFGLPTMG